MTKRNAKRIKALEFAMEYEETVDLEPEYIINGFQLLVDTGIAWELQGSYGRTAAFLLANGTIHG